MRMWDVPPYLLCQNHLLGEHNELHKFVGSIIRGKSVQGYLSRSLINPRKLTIRHDILAEEMLRRGMNHKSPLTIDCSQFSEVPISSQDNLTELAGRCEHCAARIAAEVEV